MCALPVGFYSTAYACLNKLGLAHMWNDLPKGTELKNLLKQHIWKYYWIKDAAKASLSNALFPSVFLRDTTPPIHPYKMHKFLLNLNSNVFPRAAFATVLRFWLTPNRKRICPCNEVTHNLAHHLLFVCPKTRNSMANYISTLNHELALYFQPCSLLAFLRHISQFDNYLLSFNLVVGTFDYPLY